MKLLGGVLVVLGLVALLYGGVSWTHKDKVVDAGGADRNHRGQEGECLQSPPSLAV